MNQFDEMFGTPRTSLKTSSDFSEFHNKIKKCFSRDQKESIKTSDLNNNNRYSAQPGNSIFSSHKSSLDLRNDRMICTSRKIKPSTKYINFNKKRIKVFSRMLNSSKSLINKDPYSKYLNYMNRRMSSSKKHSF
mmetsp:Transcript_14003/g.12372  ORF Transcript_14003/g.12372 Transcript_14003/m.12372 type:complete len:134 (+) Transcript_14003:571-972(+)